MPRCWTQSGNLSIQNFYLVDDIPESVREVSEKLDELFSFAGTRGVTILILHERKWLPISGLKKAFRVREESKSEDEE